MSHGDAVTELPKGFLELARSDTSPFSIVGDNIRKIYGVQFHPEVFHTKNGKKFLGKLCKYCKIKRNWTPNKITDDLVAKLKSEIGNKKLFVPYPVV